MANPFRSFIFKMRFNKQAIAAVPHAEQLERIRRYLGALGQVHPLLGSWYLQGSSIQEASSNEVLSKPLALSNAATASYDADYPTWLSIAVWNGQEDPRQGGLAFIYDAHDMDSISSMGFEDAGALVSALENPRPVLVEMLRLAVSIWPEIDWGVVAPTRYYLDGQTFTDRQTIGWIGFCPHSLNPSDFQDADELINLPERGTLLVSCAQVMDERNREHFQIVGKLDTKLVELGYLPLFNN